METINQNNSYARQSKQSGAPYKTFVLLGHTLLTLILTCPLVFRLTDHVIGPAEDNLQSLWNLWWVKHALIELKTHPYYTDYLYYPQGTSLAFHTLSLFNSLLSVPLQFFFSRITCYNLLIFLSFILAGWGMYLLAYRLTKNPGASFIASLVFAYSPCHFAHAEHHLQLSSIQFIPFFVLYLIQLTETPKLKCALLAGGFLFLTALCSWYYLAFAIIFWLIYTTYQLITQPGLYLNRKFYVNNLALWLFFGVLISPFIYPMLKEKFYGVHYLSKNLQELFSADLLAFFIPPPTHPLSPYTLHKLYARLGGNTWEATVFLGYMVILLAVYALQKQSFSKTGAWLISGLIFGVLSLGPRLHVLGKIPFFSMPMPYWLIHHTPILKMISTPSRFVVMVMFSLAVLAGYAAEHLSYRLKTKKFLSFRADIFGLTLIGIFILFEYAALPVRLCSPDQISRAPFLAGQLSDVADDYAILELPLWDYWCDNVYMYRQTYHQKKLLSGSVSRISYQAIRFLFTSQLKELIVDSALQEDYFVSLRPLLIQNRIKYIILNKYFYAEQNKTQISRFLDAAFSRKSGLKDDIIIFKVY